MQLKERKGLTQIEVTPKKLKPADLMLFSRQMASFLRAGIPILDALEMLTEDASNKELRQVLIEVADALRAGSTFADAIAVHADMFPRYYIGILRSAELSGNLDTVLDAARAYLERDLEAIARDQVGPRLPDGDLLHGHRHRHPPRELRAPTLPGLLQELRRGAAARHSDAARDRQLLHRVGPRARGRDHRRRRDRHGIRAYRTRQADPRQDDAEGPADQAT